MKKCEPQEVFDFDPVYETALRIQIGDEKNISERANLLRFDQRTSLRGEFVHDLANLLAIIIGKTEQADRILKKIQTDGISSSSGLAEKITSSLAALDRMVRLFNDEVKRSKISSMEKKETCE